VFHDTSGRFGGSSSITALVLRASRPSSRAWAFSSHGGRCDRASDTPVATCRFSPSRLGRLHACCNLAVRPVPSSGGGGLARVGGWACRRDHRPRRLV